MSFHDASSSLPGDGQQIQIQADGMVKFGNDSQTNVVFYKRPVLDLEKSRAAGRRIEVGVDYVRIQHPGERDTIDTPVANKPDAPHRWARQWMQYQKSQEQIPEGTPTSILPYFIQHPEIPANLHGNGVYTLEQLANLSEHAAQSIGMGVTQWRNMARDFLEKANKGVGVHQMQAALEKRDNEIEVLRLQLDAQRAQIDRLIAAQKGVPGTMIPADRPNVAQAHAASVAQTQTASQPYDWTQAGVHQAAQGPQSFPEYEELAPVTHSNVAADATSTGDWTIPSPSMPGLYTHPALVTEPAGTFTEPPQQPAARRRGRPPKSASAT